ncbi:MAG: ATP phosphoribosyltransferase regulatory subunit [Lachnospiraceae bacterium]|nr:ATP phosphoribosyltransferase regulatory subunit [Lachnospiraceae bacterium]
MNIKLLHTPEGVRDIYNVEYSKKVKIEQDILEVLHLYGYKGIQTPMFEFFDIFNRETGSVSSREMYKFFDREGNTLVLRPDMTPSIARCVAKYFDEEHLPIRLCYKGNTFVNNASHQGKLKETTTIGAELVNDNSSSGDAEVIALAINSFLALGITDFTVDVGQVDFYQGICEEFGIKGDIELRLRELVKNKNFFGVEELLHDVDTISEEGKKAISTFTQLYGGREILETAKNLVFNSKARKAVEHLDNVYRILSVYGYEKYISFDLAMLHNFDYYTGIIFKGYTYGTGDAVVKGGRYDNLLEQFGKKAPSVGFSVNVDELLLAMTSQKIKVDTARNKRLLVYHGPGYKPAIKTANYYRKNGIICEAVRLLQGMDIEDYVEKAKEAGYGGICYFETREIAWVINTETDKRERFTDFHALADRIDQIV